MGGGGDLGLIASASVSRPVSDRPWWPIDWKECQNQRARASTEFMTEVHCGGIVIIL